MGGKMSAKAGRKKGPKADGPTPGTGAASSSDQTPEPGGGTTWRDYQRERGRRRGWSYDAKPTSGIAFSGGSHRSTRSPSAADYEAAAQRLRGAPVDADEEPEEDEDEETVDDLSNDQP